MCVSLAHVYQIRIDENGTGMFRANFLDPRRTCTHSCKGILARRIPLPVSAKLGATTDLGHPSRPVEALLGWTA